MSNAQLGEVVRFLVVFVFVAGVASAADNELRSKNTITHGPILGRLDARQIGVWARTKRAGEFRVKYGMSADALSATSPPVTTSVAHDNTGWVMLSDLQPDTKYHYQVLAGDTYGPTGSFRTLPDPQTLQDEKLNPRGLFNFRFEFACGNDPRPSLNRDPTLPTYRTMLARHRDEIDFGILNGDWLYEEDRMYSQAAWHEQVGIAQIDTPNVVRVAPTIVGVWENYKTFLSRGKPLAQWHRNVPSFFNFDDHEILNDVYGTATAGLRDRRAAFRDIGVQAWYDYLGWANPVASTQAIHFGKAQLTADSDVLTDTSADFTKLKLAEMGTLTVHWGTDTAGVDDNTLDEQGGDPNAGVYDVVEVLDANRIRISPEARAGGDASYSIGRRSYFNKRISNCEFFFLDTRSHRDMHDVNHPAKEGVSMIGTQQRKWLMDGMKASDADFFFVISSVNFMIPHVGGGYIRETGNKDEAWTVFLDEREKLINFWDALNRPVFVLTGDLHNSFAIRITDRVWEFASGPHNSANHIVGDEGDRPGNGTFKWGPRPADIRWSTFFPSDIPRDQLRHYTYTLVQVNNVFNAPLKLGETRRVAYPRPQVVFQFYDGRTGQLRYAEAIAASE